MEDFITIDSFIAEIIADFKKYDDANLIDEDSVYRDIVLGLKRFGSNLHELNETVLKVENRQAVLPENFSSLYIAYLCEPLDFEVDSTIEKHVLQNIDFHIERTERDKRWNSCDPCCTEENEKIIVEKLFYKDKEVKYRYRNPTLLRLGKSFNRNNCHDKCRNKLVIDCPHEITINRGTLYTNFEKGNIYIRYYGIPTDDEGRVLIPNTHNGHLETYLEYHVKSRITERLIGSSEAQGLANLYSVYESKKSIALRNASNEIKMNSINPTRFRIRWHKANRRDANRYSLNF